MPTRVQEFLARRILEKELQCVYGKLIQDDEDFQATYLYVLAGRGASPADHPAAWSQPRLRSVSSLSESSSSGRFVGSYIDHNCDLINRVPFTSPRFDLIDIRTNLPIPAINMTKAVYFRYHNLPADKLRATSPPHIGRRPEQQDYENYKRSIEMFVDNIQYRTIERARTITSMIVLANIMSEEFKRRSIDFRSLQVSDKLPNSPTEQDKLRYQLRKFTKVKFARLARDYFRCCLQVTRIKKGHNRYDSKQPSEREDIFNEKKATYERLCRNLRDYPEINRENELVRRLHKETLATPEEDIQLITEPPVIEIQDAFIPGSMTRSPGRILFDAEKQRKRFNIGMEYLELQWKKQPASVLLKDARDFPATRDFLVDCNPPAR
ncbi:hypothetical protein ACHAO8_001571 [Botrytis cinerea]